MSPDTLTLSQALILVADSCPDVFTASQLVARAFETDRRRFGLEGYEESYPDSNRVLATLMGDRGLVSRGWFERKGPKLYSLSPQGRDEARRLLAGDDAPEPTPLRRALPQIKVPIDLERSLARLFAAAAFRRYEEGLKRLITYADARAFWGLPETYGGPGVDRAVGRVPLTLAAVAACLVAGSAVLSSGQSVTADDLERVAGVHRFLTDAFARHLDRQRAGAARGVGV